MTGAYVRVKRSNKWENIEIEHLTTEERKAIFLTEDTSKEEIFNWLEFACQQLCIISNFINKEVE